jgi:hypothetical protein
VGKENSSFLIAHRFHTVVRSKSESQVMYLMSYRLRRRIGHKRISVKAGDVIRSSR